MQHVQPPSSRVRATHCRVNDGAARQQIYPVVHGWTHSSAQSTQDREGRVRSHTKDDVERKN